MEGQGDMASARQCDRQAMDIWDAIGVEHKSASSIVGALRREGLDLIRHGKPILAVTGYMQHVPQFYKNSLQRGICFMQLDQLLVAMDTIKLWAQACFLAGEASRT